MTNMDVFLCRVYDFVPNFIIIRLIASKHNNVFETIIIRMYDAVLLTNIFSNTKYTPHYYVQKVDFKLNSN